MSPNSERLPTNGANGVVPVEGPDLNPSKSPFDKKEYRQILLSNGLRVVLISDSMAMTQSYNSGGIFMDEGESSADEGEEDDAKDANDNDGDESEDDEDSGDEEGGQNRGLRNAAAAMVVGVGSMSDPPECQGMAHFLEHLLFMGSTKYPEENAYDSFMSKHGGSDNAYTELESTVYHFEIPQEYLAKSLDMFAQFFTSPLMLVSSVERELNSIESEFQLAKNSDGSRVQHLMSHTCGFTPLEHPFAKFSWGNLHSLQEEPKSQNVDPLKELRKFYDEHYYASNMRLVVLGGYSLDVLQDHVVKSFSGVPSKGLDPSWDKAPESPHKNAGMPFTEASLGKIYYFAPVRDRHGLSVTWQIPAQLENWKSKPADYLAHLIGHEAQGSLLAALKSNGWATACCAGIGSEGYENASSHALFTASFTLSEEGVANWREVVSMLYQYVGMMRYHCQQGLPMWVFGELRSISELSYRYDDEPSPEDLVESLADELSPAYRVPAERLLDGSSLLFEYKPEKIQHLVDTYFKPRNARIDLASTTMGRSADYEAVENSTETEPMAASSVLFDPTESPPPQREPRFGTSYWCQHLSDTQIQHWDKLVQPSLPPKDSSLALPPQNHFIPTDFSLKPLPATDCDHPLLNSSIKLQITVGKRKQWFPATVTKYNSLKNQILLSYEDEDEKWHLMDVQPDELTQSQLLAVDFEGTLDSKMIKYRIVALASEGEGAVRRFGDETDFDAEDGIAFPPIPPVVSPAHLPKLICNTQMLKLWHLQDRTFKRPIAELRLQMHCAEANKTPLHAACADLLVYLVSEALTETAYMASVCELGSSFSGNDGGFSMRVHGFNDKLLNLFSIMFDLVMQFRGRKDGSLPGAIKEGRFDLCLESYRRTCVNAGLKASKLASTLRIRCLRPSSWSSKEKLNAIENLDVPTFIEVINKILHKIGVEALFHGNVDTTDAKSAQKEILSCLETGDHGGGLPRKKYPQQLVLRLPPLDYTLKCLAKDPTDPNTAVEVYFQVGKDNTEDRVMVDLFMEMMYEPLYDQIRTKDQFGYHVSCDSRWTDGVMGMHFHVVTSSKTAQQAEERIEKFIKDFRQTIVDMKSADFMHHLVGLAKQKLEMFNSLSEETGHYWSEIRDGRHMWELDREEVLCLKTLTKEKTVAAFDKWLASGSKDRRRVAVQVICSEGAASEGYPEVSDEVDVGEYNDECVKNFRTKHCKNQTYGRIY